MFAGPRWAFCELRIERISKHTLFTYRTVSIPAVYWSRSLEWLRVYSTRVSNFSQQDRILSVFTWRSPVLFPCIMPIFVSTFRYPLRIRVLVALLNFREFLIPYLDQVERFLQAGWWYAVLSYHIHFVIKVISLHRYEASAHRSSFLPDILLKVWQV